MHTQVWVTNLALYGIKPLSSKINKANFQWEVSNTDTYVLSTRTISKKSNNVFSCCWTGRMHFPCRHRVTSTPFSEIRCWSHSTPILAARTQLPRGRFLGHGRKAAFVAFRVMLWHFWHVVAFCGMLRLTQKNFQSHVCEPPKMNVLVLPPPGSCHLQPTQFAVRLTLEVSNNCPSPKVLGLGGRGLLVDL